MAIERLTSLPEAVSMVRPGDVVHVVTGHTRWTAASYELVRQHWGAKPGFTLAMLSLSSLGTLFFEGGMVDKVITGYSGDIFPNFTPNRIFSDAYRSGAVEVEHWSFLTFLQRLEAAARGLPAMVTRSLGESSMEANEGFASVPSPFDGEEMGLVAPLVPDVALLHGTVADKEGNVGICAPLLEGVWGAMAARRGAIVTVDHIVDDIRPYQHIVRIPAHRVLALAEVPLGAHPGGLYTHGTTLEGYGEDYEFWAEVRAASRRDDFGEWIRRWVLDCPTHDDYLDRLGRTRVAYLRAKAEPDSWKRQRDAHPPDLGAAVNSWEAATVFAARHLAERIRVRRADAVLAGAGVANLAAWLGVAKAREAGLPVVLTAELGLWGYQPTPADPYVFNHRSFPSSTMVTDSETVLGMFVGGPGTTTLACMGAAQIDRYGNVNSTVVPGGPFLVGSGGGNDVASGAAEVVVVATLTERRTVEECGYVTSPGRRVQALVTDLGVFTRSERGQLALSAIATGEGSTGGRVEAVRRLVGWDLEVAADLHELPEPSEAEVATLRGWDPHGFFLRP
ncbi:MAG: hypothetical protein JJLCMIEE_00773 [Acidimicrobiales bacterium]|nr:MAG: hypothetical protein EDR02_02875 [Actinomycetota bacterium]MBV6507718.1 hypothetical protein [Acidimicrobiales bacterium]RIK07643.1 MAG: hypothetical protein DCC48_03890 [Acidobacteriota bacterium]